MWFLRKGQRAVEALGKEAGVPVESCLQTNPNVRQWETREVHLRVRGYRARVGGARSRVACWLEGFNSTITFAVNREDRVSLLNRPFESGDADGLRIFIGGPSHVHPDLAPWLGTPANRAALRDLGLSRNESLQVYLNAVVLVGEPHRATLQVLSQLADLADRLPRLEKTPVTQRPELVQFADLTPAHFAAHPCWIQCHVVDYDQPWHDDTDEETFRPWTGPLPAGPEEGMLLVAADLTLADGTTLTGFVTPAFEKDATDPGLLGFQQPQIFLPSGRRESFWDGGVARPAEDRARVYAELGRTPDQVFPVRFAARAGLTTGLASGEVPGFCAYEGLSRTVRVTR